MDLVRKDGEPFTPREQEILDNLGLQMGPLVQNARLHELAQRQAYQMSQLQQMGRSLDPFRGLDTVMQEAVEEAARLADAVWAELYLYQEELLSFACTSATPGYEGGWWEAAPRQMVSLVEGCFHSGTSQILRVMPESGGPVNWEMANGEIADGDTGNCLGLALKTAQGTIGVLVLGGRWGQEWSEAEILVLEVFADHVAEGIAVACLVQDQESKGGRKRVKSLRQELLADVASSLRQPLTSIKGYAESLLNPEISWPEELRKEFLETLRQQTDRLDQVVSDLLIPAQWEIGAVMLDPVVFTVKGLLDQVAVDLEKEPRGCEVRFRCDATLSPVLVDPQRIVQVILWLLQSADERLGPGTMLKVEGGWDDGRNLISIGAFAEGTPADSRDLVPTLGGVAEAGSWDSWRGYWMDNDLKLVACRHILEGHGVTLQVAPSLDVCDLFRFALPPAPVPVRMLARYR